MTGRVGSPVRSAATVLAVDLSCSGLAVASGGLYDDGPRTPLLPTSWQPGEPGQKVVAPMPFNPEDR